MGKLAIFGQKLVDITFNLTNKNEPKESCVAIVGDFAVSYTHLDVYKRQLHGHA